MGCEREDRVTDPLCSATLLPASGTAKARVTRLKQQPGKDISITGSGTLVRMLLRAGVGGDVVTRLRVVGPTAPSWKKGPRSVRG